VESDLQNISYETTTFNRAQISVAMGVKMADKHVSKTKKLIAPHEKCNFNRLDDFLFTVVESIEQLSRELARNRLRTTTTATCSRRPRRLPLSNGRKACLSFLSGGNWRRVDKRR
jgi:hypothetical protein